MKVSLIADVISFRGRTSTRHLLFQSSNWDLDLFLSREEGRVTLTGQVLPRDAAAMPDLFNAVAVLVEKETFVETTPVSASGARYIGGNRRQRRSARGLADLSVHSWRGRRAGAGFATDPRR